MLRVFIAYLCIALAAAAPPAVEAKTELSSKILVVDSVENYRAAHPELKLEPLEKSETKVGIRYTLGSRVSGDTLVALDTNTHQWESPQDVQLQLRYPVSGQGSVITFVEVLVYQSSNVGAAYVISGDIGQRFIQLLIQAQSTTYFNYIASIYGY